MFLEAGFPSDSEDRPLREEILTVDGLRLRAQELAQQQEITLSSQGWGALSRRFEENRAVLESTYYSLADAVRKEEAISPGGEWLLDNYHVIEQNMRDVRRHLPRGFYKTLPKLVDGRYQGLPRSYALAFEYIAHTDSMVNRETLTSFISSYQSVKHLRIGELWAIPIMLRFALVENLRRLSLNALRSREEQKLAAELISGIFDDDEAQPTMVSLLLAQRVKGWGRVMTTGAAYTLQQLRSIGARGRLALQWFESWLEEEGFKADEIVRQEQYRQAANQVSIANTVTSLKTVASIEWKRWVEDSSVVHKVLVTDPAKVYVGCDFKTRDRYRGQIESLARKSRLEEREVASAVVRVCETMAREPGGAPLLSHVGYYLIGKGRDRLEQTLGVSVSLRTRLARRYRSGRALPFYLMAFLLPAAFLSVAVGVSSGFNPLVGALLSVFAFFPASEFCLMLVNWLVTRILPPDELAKLNFDEGIPQECRSAVVVHSIFRSREGIRKTLDYLEVRFLANRDDNLYFVVLADLSDSKNKVESSDQDLIDFARELTAEMNTKYFPAGAGKFATLIRERVFHPSEELYHGWERKRGKVVEFNRLVLRRGETSFRWFEGDLGGLSEIKYVVTLDADAYLPRGMARKLVATISHPLNHAVIDPEARIVTEGYGIIQPRIGVSLPSSLATRFARTFSGHAGLDPYTNTVSDVYQDLFHEASYLGKGVYDLRAFEQVLEGRVPQHALLSHDLFEGLFARVGLASDLELLDDFPSHYLAYTKRQHRWVRGDWQLLPWTSARIPDENWNKYRTPISGLGRWKLIDNLRRSLVAPGALLLISCLFFVDPTPVHLIAAFAWLMLPVVLGLIGTLMSIPFGYSLAAYGRSALRDLLRDLSQGVFVLCWLPYQAYSMTEAITLTLLRVYVSKKNLLEWETSHAAQGKLTNDLGLFITRMWPSFAVPFGLLLLLAIFPHSSIFFCASVASLWVAGPFISHYLSKPVRGEAGDITDADKEWLRSVARDTWYFFDELMTPERHYLIPDNVQLIPNEVVTERTSSTNISLSLLSIASAYDLGLIPFSSAAERVHKVLASVRQLQLYRGHLYNWYDIKSLEVLNPRYVSMVDSGNFVGHLIAIQMFAEELQNAPLFKDVVWSELRLCVQKIVQDSGSPAALKGALQELLPKTTRPSGIRELQTIGRKISGVLELVGDAPVDGERRNLKRLLSELERMLPLILWIPPAAELEATLVAAGFSKSGPAFAELHRVVEGMERVTEGRQPSFSLLKRLWSRLDHILTLAEKNSSPLGSSDYAALKERIAHGRKHLEEMNTLLEEISSWCDTLVREADFTLFFDWQKKLFVVGYDVTSATQDRSFYDMLASEARLGSLVAIAKGDVPQEHWFSMARQITDTPGGRTLLSWGGTMFEYLMPILVTRDYGETILSSSYKSAVRAQQIYAQDQGVPWGISESGYAGVDFHNTYQYRAFGVPGLGLKRGLSADLVISPYSSFLALPVDPRSSVQNARRLEGMKMRGRYGFFESIDFTPDRLAPGETSHVVQSHLAHHQGMILAAINNYLNGNPLQDRFHRAPVIRASELLLQERLPNRISVIKPHQAELSLIERQPEALKEGGHSVVNTWDTPYPRTGVLSNGTYTVMLDNSGGGFSAVEGDTAVTRWHEDALINNDGTFIYVKDLESGELWSTSYQPTCVKPELYEVNYNQDKIEFRRRDFDIQLHTEITISPEDNLEIRRITVTNLSDRPRHLQFTSYGEVVLGSRGADMAHPAFNKMFVQSEFQPNGDGIVFCRRPRSQHEAPVYLLHMLSMPVVWSRTKFETSREHFLGRGHTVRNPKTLIEDQPLGEHIGTVLDPIFALQTKIEVEGESQAVLTFLTAYARDRKELEFISDLYRYPHAINRAFEIAWSKSNVELRHEQISVWQMHAFQRLANALFYQLPAYRADESTLKLNRLTQAGLWRFGISGDLPIVLLHVSDPSQSKIVNELLLAHRYLRERCIYFDLVILNSYSEGYWQDFQEHLNTLVRFSPYSDKDPRKGASYLRNDNQLSPEERVLLLTVAKVTFRGEAGSLVEQLQEVAKRTTLPVRLKEILTSLVTDKSTPVNQLSAGPLNHKPKLEFENGKGGFVRDGKGYWMEVGPESMTPLPWSNVVSNENFGFLVTERGGGYSWSENSRENRLSPWSNDPVSDPLSEVIYIRDAESGRFWCPTPGPVASDAHYGVEHLFGSSSFAASIEMIESRLSISCAHRERAKLFTLTLRNLEKRSKRVEVFLYVELCLGVFREKSYRYVVSDYDPRTEILTAVNHYNEEFAGRTVFIGSNLKIQSYSADRAEFIGRNSDRSNPHFLTEGLSPEGRGGFSKLLDLQNTVGAGLDPCGVIKVIADLPAESEKEIRFFLGEAPTLDHARSLARHLRTPEGWSTEIKQVEDWWGDFASRIQVATPDRAFDIMLNGWLPYQTLSCRIFGRSAFYQSGGAFGFRDQLQDVASLIYLQPQLTREQILLAASRQFLEGDVQHWWHPPTGRGVRTRISDDLLWLPYVVHRYIEVTGDRSILNEEVSFVEAPLLNPDQHDQYLVPHTSSQRESIYQHCVLAIDHALKFGPHELPLIGGGDWNDGMNEVGKEGKGESVWLGLFLHQNLQNFIPYTQERNDKYRSAQYADYSDRILRALEEHGWDGQWYRRAYFDDGTPLGSAKNPECEIDSLSQSWAVMTRAGSRERAEAGMRAVYEKLVDEKVKVIKLLTPPFDKSSLEPGYIKAYPPGIRENGAQYTHAATWVVIAAALLGDGDRAFSLFQMLNPINHTSDRSGVETYRTEPYVLCGDVYSEGPMAGRGGWSWYTGSSGWLYVAGLEYILGLKIRSDRFTIEPAVPLKWPEYSIRLKRDGYNYEIHVHLKGRILERIESKVCRVQDGWVAFLKPGESLEKTVRVDFFLS